MATTAASPEQAETNTPDGPEARRSLDESFRFEIKWARPSSEASCELLTAPWRWHARVPGKPGGNSREFETGENQQLRGIGLVIRNILDKSARAVRHEHTRLGQTRPLH